MKVKVELDATKIVKSRLKIAGLDRKPTKISFKYERLGSYCNYCGDIDHEGRASPCFLKDTMGGTQREDNKLGPWIKAD